MQRENMKLIENSIARIWHNSDGERHRTDGPAIEHINGTKEWWFNGVRHRVEGPAIEDPKGFRGYYFHGVKVKHSLNDQTNYYINDKPVEKEEALKFYRQLINICEK